MSQQSIKQRARRQALDVASRRRRERAEREKRLEGLAVQILTAVGERDGAVVDFERRAGSALREMTEAEGLTLREAVAWCGEELTVREAKRLRQAAASDDGEHARSDGSVGRRGRQRDTGPAGGPQPCPGERSADAG